MTNTPASGFFDFAPAVLGFVLIALAEQLDEPERPAELVDALFDAAGLVPGVAVSGGSAARMIRRSVVGR